MHIHILKFCVDLFYFGSKGARLKNVQGIPSLGIIPESIL